MQIQGKIKLIAETTDVTASFKKRELVVVTEDQYPQSIMIEFTQSKCEELDAFKVGDNVTVSINIRGREWTNPEGEVKYFNSIQGWRITAMEAAAPQPVTSPSEPEAVMPEAAASNKEEEDDLPF